MRKIKICHVIGDFVNGGVESVIFNYFSHMDLTKFDVHIIGHGIKVMECAERFSAIGFTIHNIPPKRESFTKSCQAMSEIFKSEHFDIVHSHLSEWACVPMFLAWMNGVKIRINHSHMAEKPKGIKNKIYYGIRLMIGKQFATDYLACGKAAGIYLFGKKAVDSGKVSIVTNAIDLNKFKFNPSTREKIRKELKIDHSTIVVGHVGRFFEQKNHIFLIDIFEKYLKINSNSILILLGEGELKNEIQDRVSRKGITDKVKFLGVRSDVNNWYQAMDIFVLPSLFEGLPVVGVEAQASGITCLFSDSITNEINISAYTHFVSLSKSAEQWAGIIDRAIDNHNRGMVTLDSRYDINKCALSLETFYLEKFSSLMQEKKT